MTHGRGVKLQPKCQRPDRRDVTNNRLSGSYFRAFMTNRAAVKPDFVTIDGPVRRRGASSSRSPLLPVTARREARRAVQSSPSSASNSSVRGYCHAQARVDARGRHSGAARLEAAMELETLEPPDHASGQRASSREWPERYAVSVGNPVVTGTAAEPDRPRCAPSWVQAWP